jgi:transcription elongation GreA/GreB family factor
VSKAFTREHEDAGFAQPSSSLAIPQGPFRLTATGALRASELTDPRVKEALARAEVLEPITNPERAALGVTVRVRTNSDEVKAYRLVSAEEHSLLLAMPHALPLASVEGPIGRALLGARVGDVCEVSLPRGMEELEVLALEGER